MIEKYKAIVKVDAEKFVKYRTDNLLSFTKYLDKAYPGWRYFNVFNEARVQVASFTNRQRPVGKQV